MKLNHYRILNFLWYGLAMIVFIAMLVITIYGNVDGSAVFVIVFLAIGILFSLIQIITNAKGFRKESVFQILFYEADGTKSKGPKIGLTIGIIFSFLLLGGGLALYLILSLPNLYRMIGLLIIGFSVYFFLNSLSAIVYITHYDENHDI